MSNLPNKIILARNLIEDRKTNFTVNSIPNRGIDLAEWIQYALDNNLINIDIPEVSTPQDRIPYGDTDTTLTSSFRLKFPLLDNNNRYLVIDNGGGGTPTSVSDMGLLFKGNAKKIYFGDNIPSYNCYLGEFKGDKDTMLIHGKWGVVLSVNNNNPETDTTAYGLYISGFENVGNEFNDTGDNHNLGDVTIPYYPQSRNNSGTFTPINFLYTNTAGTIQSGPLSLITGSMSEPTSVANTGTGTVSTVTSPTNGVAHQGNLKRAMYQFTALATATFIETNFNVGVSPIAPDCAVDATGLPLYAHCYGSVTMQDAAGDARRVISVNTDDAGQDGVTAWIAYSGTDINLVITNNTANEVDGVIFVEYLVEV